MLEHITPRLSKEEQALWEAWTSTRSRLFFFYGEWSRKLAGHLFRRYPHPLAEWGDYINLGSIGLLQAIDRFDPSRGTRFQSYAEPYIKGHVLKGLECYIQDAPSPYYQRDGRYVEEESSDEDLGLEQLAEAAIGLAFGYFLELGIMDAELDDQGLERAHEWGLDAARLEEAIRSLSEREVEVEVEVEVDSGTLLSES